MVALQSIGSGKPCAFLCLPLTPKVACIPRCNWIGQYFPPTVHGPLLTRELPILPSHPLRQSPYIQSFSMLARLPVDLILEITQHCSFSDLWRCAQTCRQFREVAAAVAIYLYRIDLHYERQNDKFTCLVRGAMVYLESQLANDTNGADTSSVDYSDPTFERVARRVCQEIYDITPEASWEAEFERLMETAMLTAFQHATFHGSSHSVSHYAYFCGALQQEAIAFFEISYKNTARDVCLDLLCRHLSIDPYLQPLSNLAKHQRERILPQFRAVVTYLCALGKAGVVNASDLQRLTSLHLLRVLGATDTMEIAEARLNTVMDLLQVVIKSRYFSWQNGRELSFFSSLLSEAADTHAQFNKQHQDSPPNKLITADGDCLTSRPTSQH